MFDMSVNLTSKRFDNDHQLVIDRAKLYGINGMLIIGSNVNDSIYANQIILPYKNYCWATAGVHPHYANLWNKNTINIINNIINKYKTVVAIGECGLDFYRNLSSKKQQIFAFNAQLELATQYSLPLFLHCRNAFSDFIKILKKWIDKIPISVIHCFSGNQYELQQCLDMNLYIGISELFFNKKYRIFSINDINIIPKNKIVIETDSPYLLFKNIYKNIYKKYQGRNEPFLLVNLVKKIATYQKNNIDIVKKQTEKNTRILLNI
ncbi:TatD family hydrolase [Enterobacteriaceae endosymbiont of Neohaemonia nigricornis]|uniref:TatD family hydrolase n=1 Tax=Enterobacteriaceae endosymbiont of Neohaemonia nigricornis TaxID=2675792 RepID=UPI001449456A|nr:TatD family hydrolase [Enterobacteriaceae endosymbiont of Neohaemonia nigricornis]QJC30478.1 hydrolase TatD [Enterobacteriaceae endosymbiont of Neohaemonia nigricornis]